MSSDRSLDRNSSPAIDRRLGRLSTTDIYDDIVGPSSDGTIGAPRPFFLLPLCSSLVSTRAIAALDDMRRGGKSRKGGGAAGWRRNRRRRRPLRAQEGARGETWRWAMV